MSYFRRRVLERRYNHACRMMWVGDAASRQHYTDIVMNLATIEFLCD